MISNILKKMFKKRDVKLKKQLNITQDNERIYINGMLGKEHYRVTQLVFKARFTEFLYKINVKKESNEFEFSINLSEHKELFSDEEQIYDLYLMVKVSKDVISEEKAAKLDNIAFSYTDKDGGISYEYPMRLGKFQRTVSSGMQSLLLNNKKCILYKTVKGNLSFSVNHQITPDTKMRINYLDTKKNIFKFGGKLFTKNSEIESIELALNGRDAKVETKLPVKLSFLDEETEKKFGLNRYNYEVDIDLNTVFNDESFNDDIYDFYFEIKYHDYDEKIRIRIGNPKFRGWKYTRSGLAVRGDSVFAISPYYTVKRFNLSLQVDSFKRETYKYLRKIMRWTWLLRFYYRKKRIWVIGERPYKAQDTGYHFFKYIRENHPNKNAYYVIEHDSVELKNVEPYGNILYYKSKKHIKCILMATRIIGSHHPDYLFPLRTNDFIRKVKAKKVFLQHGVLGTKNTEHFYGKKSPSFDTDLFLVSSDYEKSIIVNDFEYRPDDVVVTGLSRFDSLFDNNVQKKRQLLIIPTWREWLVEEHKFLESEYFERYKNLIYNPELHELANQYNFEIIFCLHPNMQKFTPHFKSAPVKVISQGEVDVQDLMKESAMMITDYSSVAFDFSFLNKPIVYYQFDRKRYIGKRGSHLDLDNDLPGDIAYELDEVISLTKQYAQIDFKMKQENRFKASNFLKYKDKKSSERIYNTVSQKIKRKPFYETELYNSFFKRFRKSKYYFPVMKRFYKLAKHVVKIDDNLILFESGVGKQFSDNPKVIYEEILRRGLDYKKVWVCNKKVHLRDPNTIRIKRLSPSYYYYLAKSKLWINNQNFPTYIDKRPQTTYIQTWHGTPLRKMLFDIENIMGRSDDYLERVSKATKNWDYLISPSPYATQAFKSAFRYKGEILETGYPRNDIFYKEKRGRIASRVKDNLNIPTDKKVILYAPTFRDNHSSKRNKFLFNINMDLDYLKEKLGDEYIILLRMHVVISNKIKIADHLKDFIKNVSYYSDVQELLLISDILITDYSSVMFDYANTKRPMLFYTYDLEVYRDEVRGFYMDFENEAPGPLMKTTDDIVNSVLNIDEVQQKYSEKYKAFYDKYCQMEDGNAGKRIVGMLIEK